MLLGIALGFAILMQSEDWTVQKPYWSKLHLLYLDLSEYGKGESTDAFQVSLVCYGSYLNDCLCTSQSQYSLGVIMYSLGVTLLLKS